jgi:phosphosulfolactate phosphohydrolase-like enzyme
MYDDWWLQMSAFVHVLRAHVVVVVAVSLEFDSVVKVTQAMSLDRALLY